MSAQDVTVGGKINITTVASTFDVEAYNTALTGGVNLGEITTEGVAFNKSRTSETISTNNLGVVRTLYTDSEVTVAGTLSEDTPATRYFITGVKEVDGVLTDDGMNSWRGGVVVDSIDNQRNDGIIVMKRLWLPNAQVTETAEQTISRAGAILYGFTVTAYNSDLIDGGKYRSFTVQIDAETLEVIPPAE